MTIGVILPQALPTASSWQLADFLTLQRRSKPATDGACVITFDQLDPDERWLIDHAVITCDSTLASTMRLYEGIVDDLALLDGSSSGNFDVADWPNGLAVQPTRSLIARWDMATAGATAVITLQLRVLRRVG